MTEIHALEVIVVIFAVAGLLIISALRHLSLDVLHLKNRLDDALREPRARFFIRRGKDGKDYEKIDYATGDDKDYEKIDKLELLG